MLDKYSALVLLTCLVVVQAKRRNAGHLEYCDKDNPNCADPTKLCAPPENGNKKSQWLCYECWCSEADQCYRENRVTLCNCTGYEGFGKYCNETNCNPDHCSFGGECNPEDNTCTCLTDFLGTFCEIQYLPCDDNPGLCNNNGYCHDQDGKDQYVCECFSGWKGDHCENNIDDCLSNPCTDAELCVDKVDGYLCATSCEHHNPCKHGGTCYHDNNGFFCVCPPGYTGVYCNKTNCNPDHCSFGGECNPEDNTCTCLTDFWGTFCENQYLPCDDNSDLCNNNGYCHDLDGKDQYVCECFSGWKGDHCENNIDDCLSNPCTDAELCVDKVDGYVCATSCEHHNPCKHGGTCYHDNNGFFCVCPPGYTGVYCNKMQNQRQRKLVKRSAGKRGKGEPSKKQTSSKLRTKVVRA